MGKPRVILNETDDIQEIKEGPKPEKQRRIFVKNPLFFLFKKISENGDLSPIGSYETEGGLCTHIENALNEGISQNDLRCFKGRPLELEVKETKRRIKVK